MALLQVYPWHVDTLLQMSEVHRLQSGRAALTVSWIQLIHRHWRRIRLCRTSTIRFRQMSYPFIQRLNRSLATRL
jgi:hypothetical protein